MGLGGSVNANHFVAAFSIDTLTGALTPVAGSPSSAGNGSFSVAVDQSGKYLYTANSFDNTISAFTIDASTGALTSVRRFSFPQPAQWAGSRLRSRWALRGMFLYTANQGSDNISGLGINATTGALTPISGSPFASVANPFDSYHCQGRHNSEGCRGHFCCIARLQSSFRPPRHRAAFSLYHAYSEEFNRPVTSRRRRWIRGVRNYKYAQLPGFCDARFLMLMQQPDSP